MKKITFFNQKGGVGKTSLIYNIAYYFSLTNKTLLWDLDSQSSLSFICDFNEDYFINIKNIIKNKTNINQFIYKTRFKNLYLIPSSYQLKNIIIKLDSERKNKKVIKKIIDRIEEDFFYIFLDPQASKSLLIENILYASDYIFIPLVPNPINFKILEDDLTFIKSLNFENKIAGFILNMVDTRKKNHQETIELIKKIYSNYFIDIFIPCCSKIEEIQQKKEPLELFAKRSKSTILIRNLFDFIYKKIQ